MATKQISAAQQRVDLTVVVPALKEERRIGKTLEEMARYLRTEPFFQDRHVEVLVVTADSPDRTQEIVAEKAVLFDDLRLLTPGPKLGKGRDVQFGMLRARGDKVMYMDADLATPLYYIPRFYTACAEGSDVVAGTRNLLKHRPRFTQRLISSIGNILFKVASGVWIEDSQCGFKMFTAQANRICFSRLTILEWGFDMEVLTIAKLNGLRIKCVRINDWTDQPDSTFTTNGLMNSMRSLKELGEIFLNRLRGVYIAPHDDA